MARASCSFAFSNSFALTVARCVSVLELHFRAQHIDAGHQAVLLQIQRLVVQRLGRLLLGPGRFGARARPERMDVSVPATLITKSRALTDMSRAASTLCVSARASFSAARSTTDCDTDTRASKTLNGPTMLGTPGNDGPPGRSEAEGLQVDHLPRFGDAAIHVRQQLAEHLPADPARAADALFGEQHAEVVLKRAHDRVEDRNRDDVTRCRPRGHAAEEWRHGGRHLGLDVRARLGCGRRGQKQHENERSGFHGLDAFLVASQSR